MNVRGNQIIRMSRNATSTPKIGIFWVLKEDCFRRTFSQCAISRFSCTSWIDLWHTDSKQCSKLRPQTAPAEATSGRQDYRDFKAPLLSMLLVLAPEALTNCATKTVLFQYSKYTYFGGRCGWCGVSWHQNYHIYQPIFYTFLHCIISLTLPVAK